MIEGLLKLANHLDARGYMAEANMLDAAISKMAGERPEDVQLLNWEHSQKVKQELNENLKKQLEEDAKPRSPSPPPGIKKDDKNNEALDMHEGHDHENHAADYAEDMIQENESHDKDHHSDDMLAGAFSIHEASNIRRGGW